MKGAGGRRKEERVGGRKAGRREGGRMEGGRMGGWKGGEGEKEKEEVRMGGRARLRSGEGGPAHTYLAGPGTGISTVRNFLGSVVTVTS